MVTSFSITRKFYEAELWDMRGYCVKCQEYRSENGLDAWKFVWVSSAPLCEKCGGTMDLWLETNPEVKSKREKDLRDPCLKKKNI